MNKKNVYYGILVLIIIVIFALLVKFVLAAVHHAEATTNTLLSADVYTNNSVPYSFSIGTSANRYAGDFDVTGRSETITDVEICFDLDLVFTSCGGTCDDLFLGYSFDGGEGSPVTLETLSGASTNYTDVPGHKCHNVFGVTSWTWTTVTQTNIHLRVAKQQGGDTATINVDYLYMKVSYTAADTTDPVVTTLNYPGDNTYVLTNIVDFNATATDNSGFGTCTLFGNFSGSFIANETTTSVVNNTETNVTINVADGQYLWNMQCNDSSGNWDFYDSNYTVKIDTTPPTIWLENPENNNYTTEAMIIFYFNVTDFMTNITSCELIVDDTEQDSTIINPVPEGQTRNLSTTLGSGNHTWYINCTDGNGWSNMSLSRNLTVNLTFPAVSTLVPSYEQGEQVTIQGENWNNNADIMINITLINTTVVTINTVSDGSGNILVLYNMSYNHPIGQQNLSAVEIGNPADNASGYFTVTKRIARITLDDTAYYEGNSIFIFGTDFSPNTTVVLNFSYSGGSEQYTANATTTGYFNFTYNISYSTTLGLWNITAYDTYYANLNDTDSFTVNDRVATVKTDKTDYVYYENITITGSGYSINASVQLLIYDEDAGKIAPGYPIIIDADPLGNFSTTWNVSDTCSGNFSIEAADLTYAELNSTTYFNITDSSLSHEDAPDSAYKNNPAGPFAVGFINASDDNYSSIVLTAKSTEYYYELNWTNSFTAGTTIEAVKLTLEHYESADSPSIDVRWFNGTGYEAVRCTGVFTITTEANQTCDLLEVISTYDLANDISLRFYTTYGTGGTPTMYLDQALLNITYSGAAGCTDWGNTAPTITTVILDSLITLTPGSTKKVYCNATITDSDNDMTGANATIYYYLNESIQADDNNVHYTNSTCSYTGSTIKDVNCAFDVYYLANNGTWNCNLTVTDGVYNSSDVDSGIIDALYAINISLQEISYGNLYQPEYSVDKTADAINLGNMPLNITVRGFGILENDNNAMICPANNISVDNERYAFAASTPFASKAVLTSTDVNTGNTVPKPTNIAVTESTTTYWQLYAPPTTPSLGIGKCNGSIVFTAAAP